MAVERTKPSTTAIVVVDVQDKLASAMPAERMAQVERAAQILIAAASELGAACARSSVLLLPGLRSP